MDAWMVRVLVVWFGSLALLFLVGWLLFRLGWASWDESAQTAECDGADGSGAACAGGGC